KGKECFFLFCFCRNVSDMEKTGDKNRRRRETWPPCSPPPVFFQKDFLIVRIRTASPGCRRVQPARARPLFQSRLCRRKRRWKDRSEGGKRKECRVSPQFPRCGFRRRCCGGCRSQGIQNRTCSPRCREPEHSSSPPCAPLFPRSWKPV